MNPPPEAAFGFVDQMAQARALFGRSDFARDADVIDRGHVNQEAAGQSDVAGDARAFLAERLLGDLDDDFLALLQHFGNQLRAALLRAMTTVTVPVAVAAALMRAATTVAVAAIVATATAIASAIGTSATARMLHARAEIAAHAGVERTRGFGAFRRGTAAGNLLAFERLQMAFGRSGESARLAVPFRAGCFHTRRFLRRRAQSASASPSSSASDSSSVWSGPSFSSEASSSASATASSTSSSSSLSGAEAGR